VTTTTDHPRITVTKHTLRRADIDGRPVAVQSANRLDEAIMAIITERVRAQDTPHLVHIVGLGQDDWRLADPRSTEFPRVDPSTAKAPEPEPAEAADDAASEGPAYKPWTPPRPKATTPPVIGHTVVPAAAATDDANDDGRGIPTDGWLDPPSAAVAGRSATGAALPTVDEIHADYDVAEERGQAAPPTRRSLPSWDDMVADATRTRHAVAQEGWRALFRLPPGRAELARRDDIEQIQALPGGCWTIVVVNPKGGATKTTATRQIAATFSRHLVGPTLAWDNNPSRGNLGSRVEVRPVRTILDLIRDLGRLQGADAQMSDLADYARLQPEGFYALASARRIAGRHAITAAEFADVHAQVARFCRVIVIDTGNDETADSWQAAVGAADQLVIVTEAAQDSTEAAGEMMTDLRISAGDRLVDEAISVVSERASAGGRTRRQFVSRMHNFLAEHTRTVIDAPFDQALDGGGPIRQEDLKRESVRAWERVAAAVVDGFARQSAFRTAMSTKLDEPWLQVPR
jgi:MinD-like ATPase involved in chromosome partitioning or flagellar assembly